MHSINSSHYIESRTVTPRGLLTLVIASINNSNVEKIYSQYRNLLYQYGNGIDFSSDIILPNKELIVPSKDVITGVTILQESILKRAKDDPEIIDSISPR